MRLDSADFPASIRITAEFSNGRLTSMLRVGSDLVSINDISVIWARRPGPPTASLDIIDPVVRQFVTEDARRFLHAFWDMCDCRWLPGAPSRMVASQAKGPQLVRAAKMGFTIPPTAFTNDPATFLEFYRAQKGKVISKITGSMAFPSQEGQEFSRYTETVSTRDVGYANSIAYSPILLQAYIPKRVELRITVVGEKVFAAEIHSQATNRSRHDWRRYDLGTTPYVQHALPIDVAERCVALVKEDGLLFGAIDMILTPDNRYVFLEMNPNGEYAWIEELTGLPISAAIADVLLENEQSAATRQYTEKHRV